jgi:hypothetical protein
MIGSRPTWVITTPVVELNDDEVDDDYGNLFQDHDHYGTWPQWLDSLLMPGRWLDLPALGCIADAFDIYVFVVSVVHGEAGFYHLDDEVERQDGRVIALTLLHGHCGVHCTHTMLLLAALVGGMLHSRHHALVDASTAALELVGGIDVAADDDEMSGSVSN